MKLLILGASNEIMSDGYVAAMRDVDIKNLSIGGCSSTAGVFSYLKHGMPTADFSLLSFELNEHPIIKRGLRSHEEVEDNWKWIFHQLRFRRVEPVLIILPRLVDGRIVRSETCDLHRHLAERYGVPYLDLAKIFIDAQEKGADANQLMRDSAHMSPAACVLVGTMVRRSLDLLKSLQNSSHLLTDNVADFYLEWADCLKPDAYFIERSTSLSCSKLACLKADDRLYIRGEKDAAIIALVVNRLALGGSLKVGNVIKNIHFDGARPDAYMCVVIDVKKGVSVQDEYVELLVKNVSTGPTENTWLSTRVQPIETVSIELEAILMKRPKYLAIEFDAWIYPGRSWDLTTSHLARELEDALLAVGVT